MSETKPGDSRDGESSREAYPSGWLVLTRRRSAAKIVDALLDIGVIEQVENTRPQRYRFDPESDVSRAVIRLDAAMNAAGPNA